MYDVSDIELDFTWLERDWSSPTGDSGIYLQNKDFGGKDPSRLQNRHIIWGLNHLLLSMTLSKRYCQTIAVLKWQSVAIGVLYVARRGSLGLGWGTQNQTDLLNLTQQQSNTMGVNELVDIAVEYLGNRPIDSEVIYLTAMKAMGEAAEKGLDEPVPALVTRGIRQITWRLVGRTAASPGILRARHSRIAVMKTVALMFQENKFQKIYVLVKVDGIPTAAGGFSQGDAESTTS